MRFENEFPKKLVSKFVHLYSLKQFFLNSIFDKNYQIDRDFKNAISLSTKGQYLLDKLKENKYENILEYEMIFSIFLFFDYNELLVDIENTNISLIEKILEREIDNKSLIFPWIYDRLLYDKFYAESFEKEEFLIYEDTLKLLNNTPTGVFQLGEIVIGPLGILKSKTKRYIPPTRFVKLWHCSDPSCDAFHEVQLICPIPVYHILFDEILNILSDQQELDYYDLYSDSLQTSKMFYDENRLFDVPFLLADAFVESELKLLLIEIIDKDGEFRKLLPSRKKIKGSSIDITSALNKNEIIQLILLEGDIFIIELLEKLIKNKNIFIPSTEIRTSIHHAPIGSHDIYHQCNQLGIRAISSQENFSIVRFSHIIQKIYDDEGLKEQLAWKLRYCPQETLKEKIEAYILFEEPKKVVKELILSGPVQVIKTIKILFGYFEMPNNSGEEEILIEKILWKLGFDVNIYPSFLNKFWERYKVFCDTLNDCKNMNEDDKDRIRGTAVNLFVSLEEILEQSLSFCTWMLLADHYLNTNFEYNFEEARNFMCEQLNGYVIGSSDPLRFDNNGKNTLFPLTEGFTALIELCDNLLTQESEKYKRPETEFPSFFGKTYLSRFTFLSKHLILDFKTSDYQKLRNHILEIPKGFYKQNVLSVRNRLQHKREDFPSYKEILDATIAIDKAVGALESQGLYPNVFLFKSMKQDKFKRLSIEFADYRDRSIVVTPTPELSGNKLPEFESPIILVPLVNIGYSQEILRFKYKESSEYLKLWKNYPRKKIKQRDPSEELLN